MAKFFNDAEQNKWEISLPFGTIKRVKEVSDGRFDLLEPWREVDGKSLQELLWDQHDQLFELLWHIVEPQATERSINAEKFGKLIAAECLVLAQFAFFEEWRDFFQSLQRPNIATALEKMIQYRRKMVQMVTLKMSDPRMTELDAKMTAKMDSVLNKSFGGLVDSLDSILADTPGDNLPS